VPPRTGESYELILVGSGCASAFYLLEYLRRARRDSRVLVLERGVWQSHRWQLDHPRGLTRPARNTFVNRTPAKPWIYGMGVGGGSNCWWASTPRMLPEDFRLHSAHGVGRDWPVSYDDLEEFYQRAEEVMAVSGPHDGSPFPRSRPYPQPPHRLTDPDRILKATYPDQFFVQPTARARIATPAGRPRCCANGVCGLCPIDSKFTILNELDHLFEDPRVTLLTGASAQSVETRGDVALGVHYSKGSRRHFAAGEVIGLGANALFNPHILLRSGLDHPLLGRRLHEQVSVMARVLLGGIDNFQGSTSLTGHGYMLYAGPRRRERPALLIETSNIPRLRLERGRHRQVMELKAIFEDLPQDRNVVGLDPRAPTRPTVTYHAHSEYVSRGLASLRSDLERVLAPLPIESLELDDEIAPTEYHILGTTVMGGDPTDSIVDRHLLHHRVRNLLVLGGSTFPTGAPANPTLTLCALSMFAAEHARRSHA
jgi:choline dehydrogenase-like flavoprotein